MKIDDEPGYEWRNLRWAIWWTFWISLSGVYLTLKSIGWLNRFLLVGLIFVTSSSYAEDSKVKWWGNQYWPVNINITDGSGRTLSITSRDQVPYLRYAAETLTIRAPAKPHVKDNQDGTYTITFLPQ